MTGFESVPKVAEEAHKEFRSQGFFRAIVLALFVALHSMWRDRGVFLQRHGKAFGKTIRHCRRIWTSNGTNGRAPHLDRRCSVFSNVSTYFVAASRLLFLSQARTILRASRNSSPIQTPSKAIIGVTIATLADCSW